MLLLLITIQSTKLLQIRQISCKRVSQLKKHNNLRQNTCVVKYAKNALVLYTNVIFYFYLTSNGNKDIHNSFNMTVTEKRIKKYPK